MAPSQFGWIAGSEVIGGGAEAVRVSYNAILVSRMHLATIASLCKQTTDTFRTRNPPEPRWRHLSGNRILFVPHWIRIVTHKMVCPDTGAIFFYIRYPISVLYTVYKDVCLYMIYVINQQQHKATGLKVRLTFLGALCS